MFRWQSTQRKVARAVQQLKRATAEQIAQHTGLKLWQVRDALLSLKYQHRVRASVEKTPTKRHHTRLWTPTA